MDSLSDLESAGSIGTELVERMVDAWHRGERPPAEEFLSGHPGLDHEAAIRLVFEEFCLRQEAGMEVDLSGFARRFPQWWPELELLFDCQRLMEPASNLAVLPERGEELSGFRLLAELGRGASGRVFLASQRALADRPVVVKVTPVGRDEHLSLARLQHMNIVPLYSAQVLHDRHLQVLCMPFLGGASLARVLELLQGREPALRTGGQLVEALDRIQGGLPVSVSARGPFLRYIGRSSYVEAICWIGICLADGLQYAHDRNFVHMDIKPSNVLIAGDGQPMLLDFHLAREPIAAGDPAPAHLGGTPGYLAPEQSEAMAAVRSGRPILTAVDGRADLYSLGLILREALGGPAASGGVRAPLRRWNHRVSVGLSDIIDKCLRPDPRDRYADAAALAADLRRFLDRQPLRGVPNRSLRERWGNWRGRRPHALPRTLMLLVSALTATAASALLVGGYLQRVREIEASLVEARASLDRRQYPEAARALRRGLAVARHLPGGDSRRKELLGGLARTERRSKIEELHRLAELARFRYGIDPPPPGEALTLVQRGRSVWNDRAIFLDSTGGPVEPESEEVVRADLLDFTLAWLDLRVRAASIAEAPDARREALRVLDEAERLLGAGAAIDREKRRYNQVDMSSRIDSPPDPAAPPRSAWEHFDLGKSYLRSGEVALAAEEFQLGLSARPQDFWLNFYQGLCAYRLGRFDEAVNAFRVCIALSPGSPECYYNRALALGALGRTGQAIDDYARALDLDPSLSAASMNRGMLHYREGRLPEASADLKRALATATATAPKDRGLIHYNLALVDLAQGDHAAALANLEHAIREGDEAARTLRDRLRK